MNKLTALSKLSSAYWYIFEKDNNYVAADVLADAFRYIRRTLTLGDLKPLPRDTEGYNGRMPTHF